MALNPSETPVISRPSSPEVISQRSLTTDASEDVVPASPPSSQSTDDNRTSLFDGEEKTETSEDNEFEVIDVDFSGLPLPPSPNVTHNSSLCE